MEIVTKILSESWHVLLDSSPYILFGILIAGALKMFLRPGVVAVHLGKGKVSSVLKAAFYGIPIPLCSCGVLPAAASLKKQGANKGATTAFLISTPESGVDSISISYALLDPILTIARPVAAFISASVAGILENTTNKSFESEKINPDLSCPVDGCCDGLDCPPEEHAKHHTLSAKAGEAIKFSFLDLWDDLAPWFFVGLIMAGMISTLVPPDLLVKYLGGGISSMFLALLVGIPMYICATASTPVAASLIMSGVSPGTALVFLLVGPATNMASLSVIYSILGKKTSVIYLVTVALVAVACGYSVDLIYGYWGISAQATMGKASEMAPYWLQISSSILLIGFSIKPLYKSISKKLNFKKKKSCCASEKACH